MSASDDRVAECFCTLFPSYSRGDLLSASRESIPEWDSLASVTLLVLLQEEFHLDIDLSELEQFNSVQSVMKYVAAHAVAPEDSHGN
jgi:acyl carrier protein